MGDRYLQGRLLGRPALTLAAWAERICLSRVDVPNAVRSGLAPVRPEVALRSRWGRLALIFTGRAHRPNGQIKFNFSNSAKPKLLFPLSTTPSPSQRGEALSALALSEPPPVNGGARRAILVEERDEHAHAHRDERPRLETQLASEALAVDGAMEGMAAAVIAFPPRLTACPRPRSSRGLGATRAASGP